MHRAWSIPMVLAVAVAWACGSTAPAAPAAEHPPTPRERSGTSPPATDREPSAAVPSPTAPPSGTTTRTSTPPTAEDCFGTDPGGDEPSVGRDDPIARCRHVMAGDGSYTRCIIRMLEESVDSCRELEVILESLYQRADGFPAPHPYLERYRRCCPDVVGPGAPPGGPRSPPGDPSPRAVRPSG